MSVTLKPCPFCGGEAYFLTTQKVKNSAFVAVGVECRKCGAYPYSTMVYEGDIVATDLPGPEYKEIVYGVVFWQDSEARFAVEWKCTNGEPVKTGLWPAVSLASQAKRVYVFGNIYQNANKLPKERAGNEGD